MKELMKQIRMNHNAEKSEKNKRGAKKRRKVVIIRFKDKELQREVNFAYII